MIIGTVKGDLISIFKSGAGHLIHGCNCFHTMGAGIARQIAQEFPQALETDKMTTMVIQTSWALFLVGSILPRTGLYTGLICTLNSDQDLMLITLQL